MATVNRYTKLQPAKYTPRTLQELMIAPSYMREQHDILDTARAGLETELAQVDPLDVHSDLAKAEQAELYNQMSTQAEQLAAQGFTPTSKSDFIRLNKQYQQAISPTGTLGKIQSAKAAYEKEKTDLLANASKLGYGPEDIQRKLDEKFGEYEEAFRQTGKVTGFKAPLPPEYRDLDKDIADVGKRLGSETTTKMKQKGYHFENLPGRGVVMVSRDGQIIEASNDKAIQDAISYLGDSWLNPTGKGARSGEWQGLTDEYKAERINKGLGLQRTTKTIDTRGEKYQFSRDPVSSANVGGGSQIISLDERFTPDEFAYTDYASNKKMLTKLKEKENLDSDDRAKLYKLQEYTREVDKNIAVDPEVQELDTQLRAEQRKYMLNFDPEDVVSDYAGENPQATGSTMLKDIISGPQYKVNGKYLNEKQEANYNNYLNNTRSLRDKKENIINDISKKATIKTAGYNFAPSTPKENTTYNLLNNNFDDALRFGDFTTQFNIQGIDLADGSHRTALDQIDHDKIVAAVKNSKRGSARILRFSSQGYSGLPEVTVEVDTQEGNEINLDRWGRREAGDGDNIGDGKPIRIKLAFKKASNAIGINNLTGMALRYLSSKGEISPETGHPMGADLAKESMRQMYAHTRWKDLQKEDLSNWVTKSAVNTLMETDTVLQKANSYNELISILHRKYGDEFLRFK